MIKKSFFQVLTSMCVVALSAQVGWADEQSPSQRGGGKILGTTISEVVAGVSGAAFVGSAVRTGTAARRARELRQEGVEALGLLPTSEQRDVAKAHRLLKGSARVEAVAMKRGKQAIGFGLVTSLSLLSAIAFQEEERLAQKKWGAVTERSIKELAGQDGTSPDQSPLSSTSKGDSHSAGSALR